MQMNSQMEDEASPSVPPTKHLHVFRCLEARLNLVLGVQVGASCGHERAHHWLLEITSAVSAPDPGGQGYG